MKKLSILTLLLICSLLASCQDKKEYKAACEFNFELEPYSYNGYDVLSSHAVKRDTPLLQSGQDYIVFLFEGLDSLTFVNMETEVETINDKDYISYLPVFKEEADNRYLMDIGFFFSGFKKYNHNFEEIGIALGQRPEPSGQKTEIELNGEKYTLQMFYDEHTQGILENLSVFITHNGTKQCLLKTPKIDLDNVDRIYFCMLGDVDGDNKLDCIIRAITHQREQNKKNIFYLLFLSSEAEEGELVKHVATSYYSEEE